MPFRFYELRFSEDAAYRRVAAARLVQRFPLLYDAIASGELHLTGLLMLGPHLTPENIEKVLPRAKHRTKKELAQLVHQLDPLPDVPAGIVPLGPEIGLGAKLRKPTWAEYARSFNPVNHLPAGDRPRDWMSDTPFSLLSEATEILQTPATDTTPMPAPARFEPLGLQPLLEPLEAPQRYKAGRPSRAGGAGAVAEKEKPRRRGRYVSAIVRRAVAARDGQRCAHFDEHGRRCRETHRLEFHHLVPFALGGTPSLDNISLRCRFHNLLAAEADFGREAMQQATERQPHESLAKQVASSPLERSG